MKLELTVSEKSVNATVDKLVGNRLEKIIKDELGSFVEGHLAKKKLTGKTPPDMADLIDRRLKLLVQREVTAQSRNIKYIVAEAMERKINAAVAAHVAEQVKALKRQIKMGTANPA